jgi:hypothetical protein
MRSSLAHRRLEQHYLRILTTSVANHQSVLPMLYKLKDEIDRRNVGGERLLDTAEGRMESLEILEHEIRTLENLGEIL